MKRSHKATFICFRQWTRKKFSVLLSLSRIIRIGVLCVAYSLIVQNQKVYAQTDTLASRDPYTLQEVEITGRRSEVVSSEIARMITIVSKDEIEKAGISSITDLLEYLANIDIRQRGSSGLQADASIRGSSFDHVMILVNGINMSDAQTGHFNFDLPVDPESIERVEVLEGPAARVLGAGAFMGAVNIITKKGNNEFTALQTGGQYSYLRTGLSGGLSGKKLTGFLTASQSSSKGYMDNTDFRIQNLYYRSTWAFDNTKFDIQAGYQNKQFGAAGFYSPRFPDQYEENGTWFTSLKISTGEKIIVSPQFYWRQKNDHFVLIRNNPSFYENFHLTDIIGSKLNITIPGQRLTQNYGLDFRSESIMSNNIGLENPNPKPVRGEDSVFYNRQYQRADLALFAEYIFKLDKLAITAGLMMNRNTAFNNHISVFPGVELSYRLSEKFSLFGNYNRSLHLPTFTDLFYKDPVNQGNLHLKPNRMNAYEAGFKGNANPAGFKLSIFYNSGRDIIDWLWSYQTNSFRPVNLQYYRSAGLSADFHAKLSSIAGWLPDFVSLSYIFISVDKSVPDSVSKYYNLKHKLSGVITEKIWHNLFLSLRISYQDRSGVAIEYNKEDGFTQLKYNPFWLTDGTFTWKSRILDVFAEVSNILDTQYIDTGSSLQPGRWIKGGVIVRFTAKTKAFSKS